MQMSGMQGEQVWAASVSPKVCSYYKQRQQLHDFTTWQQPTRQCTINEWAVVVAVRQVQLSKSGVPQAVMSNRTAWLYHTGLASWLCLADSAFAASPFTSLLPLNPALQGKGPSDLLVLHNLCKLWTL